MFDGRVVEDFKLLTGTFVSVGNLRIAALAAASPLLMDAVVCGPRPRLRRRCSPG